MYVGVIRMVVPLHRSRFGCRLGARYYDTTGHFTQPDPSARESNVYSYANGNPINSSDPSGLSVVSALIAAAISLIGAAFAALFCAALPLVGCIVFAIIYGALFGALAAAISVKVGGASDADAEEAVLEGAISGGILGAVGGKLLDGLAKSVIAGISG